jgi:hypothetical protein
MLQTPITQEKLKNILDYNPETGLFTWKEKIAKKIIVGETAGSLNKHGYVCIKIQKFRYSAHRLAWLYVYGSFPSGEIDHINRIKTDNKISNLRDATPSQNCRNRGLSKRNNSGYVGISWNKKSKKWQARIFLNKKSKSLGVYEKIEDAVLAREKAEKNIFDQGGINE